MKKIITISTVLLALVGCSSGVKESLGMKKSAPDEFYVISNPDLTVPPDFKLVDPSSGISREDTYEDSSAKANKLAPDDKAFLQSLSGAAPKSNIKQVIDAENQANSEQKGVIRQTLGKLNGQGQDPRVDAVAERDRLKANKTENKPLNEGEVPQQRPSTIERILN